MIVELRRNLQVIIPRRIAEDMGLEIGDQLNIVAEDGVIKLIPVVVLPKAEAQRMGVVGASAEIRDMLVELRRNLQIIIPRRIVEEMDLVIGDQFDVVAEGGEIKLIPVVVLTKAEAQRMGVFAAAGASEAVGEAAPAPAPEATPEAAPAAVPEVAAPEAAAPETAPAVPAAPAAPEAE